MSLFNQCMFQDPTSPIMENMIIFHDYAMLMIIMIIIMIIYMNLFMFSNLLTNRNMLDNQMIEIIWTIMPMMLLMFLAIPSLKILYMTDEMNFPNITLKVIGHQWFWSYEYNDFKDIKFDSFMIKNNEMFRLLDVDNRMILPFNIQVRLLINSFDVIHSFTIPSMGVKVDALPGRINQISMMIKRSGLYFGQCSEICGVNHSFMPIVLESTNLKYFINWINLFK